MKARYILDATRPSLPIELNAWTADIMLVSNPTGSPVAIRLGGNDIPSATNYDELCAGGGYLEIPVSGAAFAVAFTQPSLASTASSSNLGVRCSVTLLSKDEAVPNFGAASFQSLSTSELVPLTGLNGPQQTPVLDLGAWGGALIYLAPTGGSGQGVITILASDDGVNFSQTPVGLFAFWPSLPAIIQVPRVARYLLVQLNGTAIPGEPAIQYTLGVRATLTEIQQLAYNSLGAPIVKTFALPGVSSIQYSFVTVGLPGVSIAAIATAGTTSGAALQFLVEASADLVNWRQVTAREQAMSSGVTLYRAVGQLDFFMRVSFFQEVGGQTLNASAYFSVPPIPDQAYILNTIQQSLGDRFQSGAAPARADIYHELEAIFQVSNTNLPSITTNTANTATNTASTVSSLGSISSQITLLATHADMNTLSSQNNTLHTDLQIIDTHLQNNGTVEASINTNTGNSYTVENANLPAINTNTSNTVTQATAINTNTAALAAALTRSSVPVTAANTILANTWTDFGSVFTAGQYITFAACALNPSVAATTGSDFVMATGTGVAQVVVFYRSTQNTGGTTPGTSNIQGIGVNYDSIRAAGYQIPAGQTHLWVFCSQAGLFEPTIVVAP